MEPLRGTRKGYYPAQIKTKSSANKIFQTKKLALLRRDGLIYLLPLLFILENTDKNKK